MDQGDIAKLKSAMERERAVLLKEISKSKGKERQELWKQLVNLTRLIDALIVGRLKGD